MTYNYAPEVVELAGKYNLQAKPVAMKNTHHAEMTEWLLEETWVGWLAYKEF